MSEPSLGSDAKVMKGGTEIGYATGARCGIDIDIIKEYIIGQSNPGVLKSGPQTYPVTIEKMLLDTEYAHAVLDGDTVSLEFAPAGTATGGNKPKFTVGNVTFDGWELNIRAEGVVVESLTGEGTTFGISEY